MNVIGLMSGTSLDGVDLLLVSFEIKRKKLKYKLIKGKTYSYPKLLLEKIKKAKKLSGLELSLLNNELGDFYADLILKFKGTAEVDLISSHGHTIFHQPEKKLTLQIGSSAIIAAKTGIKTIGDFRSTDVALNGQGAPLVPFGDELLFSEFDYCLNLGGYANISFRKKKNRIAFDICPCNIVLNYLAEQKGKPYDKNGVFASKGKIDHSLLKQMNQLKFYLVKGTKSLGNEWLEKEVLPIIEKRKISIEDKLATFIEHIAHQLEKTIVKKGEILITGGGAHNSYLVSRLSKIKGLKVVIPSNEIIDFKEALIFALLGYLRELELVNTFASSTGADRNSSGGAIYFP